MFLGFDSSTQSLTAVVIDPETGEIPIQLSVHFGNDLPSYKSPNGFLPGGVNGTVHADPMMWVAALDLLMSRLASVMDLSKITCISGSGQQHGTVYLDATFDACLAGLDPAQDLVTQISPTLTRATSPIWMDTSTSMECKEITETVGSAENVCAVSGSTAVERFSGPQIRKFYKTEGEAYAATHRIHLVSSFFASILVGKSVPIDFGDGAGMNLLSLSKQGWDTNLLAATAPDLGAKLLPPAPTTTIAGTISPYFTEKYGFSGECRIALFTGDNPASLVGMGATTPGTVVISLGTSDTFFAAMPSPLTDPNGYGHVFGNPAGGFMSLICFRNGSLAREALRDRLGVDWSAFDLAALNATKDQAGKNLMLPFFGPEITPRHDFTEPLLAGSADFENGSKPELQIRALLEGQFLNMRLHSEWMGVKISRIRLTGGASKNDGIAQMVADIFQAKVERLDVSNSAALGGALIAAAADGCELERLQETFCKAEAGAMLVPDPALAEIYQDALDRFRKFLDTSVFAVV